MGTRIWSPEVKEMGDRIAALTAAGAVELGAYLENVHGVKAADLPLLVSAVDTDPDPELVTPEPAGYDVWVEGFEPARKIMLIRAVRELTGLGLKESKDRVEASPQVVRERLPRPEAETLRSQLEAAGARVSLRASTP